MQKIFDNALKIFAHLVPLLPLQRHAVLLQGEAGHEAGQGLGPLAVPVGLPPVRVILADHVQDVATLRAKHQLFSLFSFFWGIFSSKTIHDGMTFGTWKEMPSSWQGM